MGTKYSSQSATGYNSSPPSDDGTAVASNEVKWSFIKTKIGDPVKTLADNINAALNTHFDESVVDKAINFTTTAAEHKKTINATAAITVSLADATTVGTGYIVSIKNSHSAAITIDLATGTDTLDGTVGGSTTLAADSAATFITDAGATGYYIQNIPFENLTGQVTSVGTATTVTASAITGQTDIGGNINDVDELIISDAGAIRRTDASRVRDYVFAEGGYFTGLETSNGADTAHDIDVAAGACVSKTGGRLIVVISAFTKQIDNDWAEGDNLGGLATGARSVSGVPDASTWYHFFLILNPTSGSVDAGWDTSTTATNLLSDASGGGYTLYKMIASHYVDATNDIDPFFQYGDRFYWNTPVRDVNRTAVTANVEYTDAISVPPGYNITAHVAATATSGLGDYFRFYPPDITTANASASNQNGENAYGNNMMSVITDTSRQLQYKTSSASGIDLVIITHGWEFDRSAL